MALMAFADQEKRVVVTKDDDFVDSHILFGRPEKLLLISTGNISNQELEAVFMPVVASISQAFETNSFIELGRSGLVVRN